MSNVEINSNTNISIEIMEVDNLSDVDITDLELYSDPRAGTPTELVDAAAEASEELLPSKSKNRYMMVYNHYMKWKVTKTATSNSERVVLAYFNEKVKAGKKPTTLWAEYSMLKATLKIFDKVNIETYSSLTALLKRKAHGYVPKKAKTFSEEEVRHFLDNAPDVAWLDVKAALVFGISGCCRSHELPTIRMMDISRYDDMYYVTVPKSNTKTSKENSFAITGPFLDIVRRYEQLRPSHATSEKFFLNYQNGKCTSQTIGKNKFYKMPHRIAQYLNLPDANLYTGNCLLTFCHKKILIQHHLRHAVRRTSTTIFANSGATTGHKSTTVCESYIDESVGYKKKTSNAIVSSINCSSTSSTVTSSVGHSVDMINKSIIGESDSASGMFTSDESLNEIQDSISVSSHIIPQAEPAMLSQSASGMFTSDESLNEIQDSISVSSQIIPHAEPAMLSQSVSQCYKQEMKKFHFENCTITMNFTK